METVTLNAVLSVIIFGLVLVAGLLYRGAMPTSMTLLWLAFLSLALVSIVTSAAPVLGLSIDSARLAVGFLRGITIVLLIGVVMHRWRIG